MGKKRAFKMKQKAFLIIFKWLSLKQIKRIFFGRRGSGFKLSLKIRVLFYTKLSKILLKNIATNIYLFWINNRNTRKKCEICSRLTIKKPERMSLTSLFCRHCWLWTYLTLSFSVSIVDFEHGWCSHETWTRDWK